MHSSDLSKRMFLDCLSPRCGAALATAFAEVLAGGLDSNQLNALGSFFNIVGDSLSYMSAQMDLNEAKCKKKSAQNSDDDSESDNTKNDDTEFDNEQSENTASKQESTDKNSGGTQQGQGRNGEAVVT